MKVSIHVLLTSLLIVTSSARIRILDLLRDYGLGTSYRIKTVPLPQLDEYDFIVVGSGPGGAPVANRLSENKTWKVLLLEAGKPEGLFHQVPLLSVSFVNTEYDWQYRGQPQKNACLGIIDQKCPFTKGKALGGSSSINSMIYARGHQLDYDSWAKRGNYGWSFQEVLPYFRKSERATLRQPADALHRGRTGYLRVQNVPWHTPLTTAFLKSGKQLGYNIIDYNGRQRVGFSYTQATMSDGARCSASQAYLQVNRSNLDIVSEARVSKVLIDDTNRVYGVEFIRNNKSYRVRASKEVILSAGSIDTAKLLMLSGIGPKDHLQSLGIKVVKDAKVGYNLQDHAAFAGLTFSVNQSVSLIAKNIQTPRAVLQYAIKGSGPYSTAAGIEALAFIRTKYATDARPDLELAFGAGAFNMDDGTFRRSRRVSQRMYDAIWKPLENQDVWAIWPAVQLPRSKGRVKLNSTNIEDDPIIDANLLDDPSDVEILLEGIKLSIEISKSKAFQRYHSQLHEEKIPGCESFTFASDDYWRCGIRHLTVTFNHEIGTAKMGSAGDSDAVVDPELRVYGVSGLRVIDASIIPEIPIGHLAATVYMIAEKGADMIRRSWRG
ncbi:glucose dehydrogenase [FAD, quinone]-like [Diachasmimorpha longicaudata]|uniref:glucose dehydrogenase [FAD, quinone]-like n=1 Tax=Diachasmimorpha longicaudata TaxID=58733 RepID=UPI0030B88DD2